ncbi:hypothetical protein K402DRAFT_19317 [Aulographum hederae CBS 113979]|uniref:Uncharacterized protein n=1 Tax=Aulographum hederae CBS 113979 TaxID=1176131 RepID=A0A6G1H698_9PEZI|nr:hypothetical protein K402DRAFT_19317 [Aulographum hederae CBS 113979]
MANSQWDDDTFEDIGQLLPLLEVIRLDFQIDYTFRSCLDELTWKALTTLTSLCPNIHTVHLGGIFRWNEWRPTLKLPTIRSIRISILQLGPDGPVSHRDIKALRDGLESTFPSLVELVADAFPGDALDEAHLYSRRSYTPTTSDSLGVAGEIAIFLVC